MKKNAIIIAIIAGIIIASVSLVGGFVTHKAVEKQSNINFNTYCEKGEIVQTLEDGEYLLLMDNGHYFSFYSNEAFENGTVVNVTFDYGKTDKIEDDIIIAVSVDLYEMAESLFDECFPIGEHLFVGSARANTLVI